MPIEIKELVVRAFVTSLPADQKDINQKIAKTGSEISDMQAEMLQQLRKMITDKKER